MANTFTEFLENLQSINTYLGGFKASGIITGKIPNTAWTACTEAQTCPIPTQGTGGTQSYNLSNLESLVFLDFRYFKSLVNGLYETASKKPWKSDDGETYVVCADGDASATTPPNYINFSSMFSSTNDDLHKLMDYITVLINYDFSMAPSVPQTVPGYKLVDSTGNQKKPRTYRVVMGNLGLPPASSTTLLTSASFESIKIGNKTLPLLPQFTALFSSPEHLSRMNFYKFRRTLLLMRTIIEFQFARILDSSAPAGTTTNWKTMVTNYIKAMNTRFDAGVDGDSEESYAQLKAENDSNVAKVASQIAYIKQANREFETVRTNMDNTGTNAYANEKRLLKYSIILMVVAIILAAVCMAGLLFGLNKPFPISMTISATVLFVSLMSSFIYYFVSAKYSIEPFNVQNPLNITQDLTNAAFGFNANSADENLISAFVTESNTFLENTDKASDTMSLLGMYDTLSKIHEKDIVNLQTKKMSLENSLTKMTIVNNELDRRQRNNMAIAWLLLGLITLASFTMIAYSLLSFSPLFQMLALFAGGALALVFSMMMFIKMSQRTRRDPSKYYWRKPTVPTA